MPAKPGMRSGPRRTVGTGHVYVRLAPDLFTWLDGVAAENRRSLNGQVTMFLEEARKRDTFEFLRDPKSPT